MLHKLVQRAERAYSIKKYLQSEQMYDKIETNKVLENLFVSIFL